jgi:hypothetical protein
VKLISVEPGAFWSFVYEHTDGLDRVTLSEEELGEVELFEVTETPAFDGDPEQFRLGLEARRITKVPGKRGRRQSNLRRNRLQLGLGLTGHLDLPLWQRASDS